MLVGGLNNRPDLMDGIAQELRLRGINTLIVPLSGHRPGETFDSVTGEIWIKDIDLGRRRLEECFPNQHYLNVSYSVGALATIAYVNSINGTAPFEKVYLLAPAIAVHATTGLLRLLFPLSYFNFSITSLTPKEIRVHDEVPISIYREIATLAGSFAAVRADSALHRTKACVFVAPKDELVSRARIHNWVLRSGLENWRISQRPETFGTGAFYHHLLIDRSRISGADWDALINSMARYLLSAGAVEDCDVASEAQANS